MGCLHCPEATLQWGVHNGLRSPCMGCPHRLRGGPVWGVLHCVRVSIVASEGLCGQVLPRPPFPIPDLRSCFCADTFRGLSARALTLQELPVRVPHCDKGPTNGPDTVHLAICVLSSCKEP